jgi:hypothetical protein
VRHPVRRGQAVLDPVFRLLPDTTYSAWVEGAYHTDGPAVKDRVSNEMVADRIWHFTTGTN